MNHKSSIVSQTNLGIYVWQFPDGQFFADEDANVLSITAMRGDIRAMSKITSAAKFYGAKEGRPVFLEGRRKINDEELKEQIQRAQAGLVPDPYDIGEYKDGLRRTT